MTGVPKRSAGFTPSLTREILAKACGEVGISPDEAVLLRHQTNAVYLLEQESIIAKVARLDYNIDHVKRTVQLTQWLTDIGFPTVQLASFNQPVIIDGIAVTFWKYLHQTRPITAADIAGPLLELHKLQEPPRSVPALPALDAMTAITFSLANETILSADERVYLATRWRSLTAAMNYLHYEQPSCLLHGDPQHGNALWDNNHAVLSDWESVVIGPAEWDLVTIEIHCRRFGYPQGDYDEFCQIYGRDVRQWEGYSVLRDVRELRMISTNARKSAPGSGSATEVKRRIAQLQQVGIQGTWSIL